jgi:hypothetical protein
MNADRTQSSARGLSKTRTCDAVYQGVCLDEAGSEGQPHSAPQIRQYFLPGQGTLPKPPHSGDNRTVPVFPPPEAGEVHTLEATA